jgi:hypothetical protein
MRTLTRNEKVLGGLFLALAIGLALLLLATSARRWVQQGQTATREVQARIAEARQWISERPVWTARADWLRANPLPVWQEDESEAELIQSLQGSLAREGLTINSQRLVAATDQPNRAEIGVELSIKGTTTQIVRWLHSLQQPGEFISIRQINLRADPDKTNLRADISLARHYSTTPSDNAEDPPSQTPTQAEPPLPTEADSTPAPDSSLADSPLLDPNPPDPPADFVPPDPAIPSPSLDSLSSEQPALAPEPIPEQIPTEPTPPTLAPDITPLPPPDSPPPLIQP